MIIVPIHGKKVTFNVERRAKRYARAKRREAIQSALAVVLLWLIAVAVCAWQ